jgi:hypothetical protein
VNILNPGVKKGNWSNEEQEKIFQSLSQHYTSWSSMSKILPGRTENSIKNYFYSSIRRLKSNPIMDILNEIFISKKRSLNDLDDCKELMELEFSKFNRLSQKICEYLLSVENQKETFAGFLL